MPYCQFCGNQVSPSDRFCMNCGRPVVMQNVQNTNVPQCQQQENYAAASVPTAKNYYDIPPEDEIGRKVWEYLREKNWLKTFQSDDKTLEFSRNGETYIYLIKPEEESEKEYFVLSGHFQELPKKSKVQQLICGIGMVFNSKGYTSKFLFPLDDDIPPAIGFMYSVSKKLVRDAGEALEIAISDLDACFNDFMNTYEENS